MFVQSKKGYFYKVDNFGKMKRISRENICKMLKKEVKREDQVKNKKLIIWIK